MNNQQFQSLQIDNTHCLRTDSKGNSRSSITNLNQSRQSSKVLSVDRVKLKQANENVEQLIDLWQRHKSITQSTPIKISQSFHYHSTTQKNESFVIEEIPETREVSPMKPEEIIIKPRQLFETNQSKSKLLQTSKQYQTHKKTTSLYFSALSKSDAFSSNKKATKENQKVSNNNNGQSNNKKQQLNSSSKKLPKELQSIVLQLQQIQKSLLSYYQKQDKMKKTEIDEQFNILIDQIKSDFTK